VGDSKPNGFYILTDMLTDKNDAMNVGFSFLGMVDIVPVAE
jgi:hypothetical protein